MKKTLLLFTFIYGISFSYSFAALQEDLETSYKTYSDAIASGDPAKIQSSMSAHAFIKLKNLIISAKQKYPQDFVLNASEKLVNLKKEKYQIALEKASTANCIYFGKGFNYTKALVILHFVKEGNQWKFDDVEERCNDEILSKMDNKDYAFISKDYPPTGITPATAKEIINTDYRGLFNLQVEGYKAVVKINGVSQELNNSKAVEELVLGGLKKGINYIEVKLTPIISAETNAIKISLKAVVKNQEKEVFNYQDTKPSIMFTREFEIN